MQRTFTDTEGRKWSPRISLYTAGRIKRQCSVDVNDIDSLNSGIQDPLTLMDMLFCAIEDEAIKRSISAQDFGNALGGDSLEQATEALLYGIADFFGDQKKRTAFISLIEALKEESTKNVEMLEKQIPMIKAAIRKSGDVFREELTASLAETVKNDEKKPPKKSKDSGNSSGNTPESLV